MRSAHLMRAQAAGLAPGQLHEVSDKLVVTYSIVYPVGVQPRRSEIQRERDFS